MISQNPLLEFDWGDLLDAGSELINIGARASDRKTFSNNYSYSSAAKAASNLIAVFPVLCSSSLSKDTAAMVTKAIERKATVILQLALTATNITTTRSGMEYLRQFHQNLNVGGMSGDDLIQAFNNYVDTHVDASGYWDDDLLPADESYYISNETKNHFVRLLMESYNTWYDEDINPNSLNDFLVQESSQGFNVSFRPFVLSETETKGKNKSKNYGQNVDPNKSQITNYYASSRNFDDDNYKRGEEYRADAEKYKRDQAATQLAGERDRQDLKSREALARAEREEQRRDSENRSNASREKAAGSNAKWEEERYNTQTAYTRNAKAQADRQEADNKARAERDPYITQTAKSNAEIARQREMQSKLQTMRQMKQMEQDEKNKYIMKAPELKDNDVKKMNEMVPTLMIVRFYNVATKSQNEFIIGVKSKCIKTNADEIFKKIYNNNRDGKGLVNLIRATTGEIKFVKDLLLGLDQTKADVMSMNKKGSNEDIWHILQVRAQNAKGYLRQNRTNYASAITTVVITQEDADYLYKQMNIDVNNPKIAMQFMKAYNLLGFAIVDDTTESAKFLWDDGDLKFEELSYTMMEREDRDSSYKKVVNLLAKIR